MMAVLEIQGRGRTAFCRPVASRGLGSPQIIEPSARMLELAGVVRSGVSYVIESVQQATFCYYVCCVVTNS